TLARGDIDERVVVPAAVEDLVAPAGDERLRPGGACQQQAHESRDREHDRRLVRVHPGPTFQRGQHTLSAARMYDSPPLLTSAPAQVGMGLASRNPDRLVASGLLERGR